MLEVPHHINCKAVYLVADHCILGDKYGLLHTNCIIRIGEYVSKHGELWQVDFALFDAVENLGCFARWLVTDWRACVPDGQTDV